MTENKTSDTSEIAKVPNIKASAAATSTANPADRYPAMQFVVQFARLAATIISVFFLILIVVSIGMGIFNENVSFLLGLINAGFYTLIGLVLVGLTKGMGEAFELLLELEKRK